MYNKNFKNVCRILLSDDPRLQQHFVDDFSVQRVASIRESALFCFKCMQSQYKRRLDSSSSQSCFLARNRVSNSPTPLSVQPTFLQKSNPFCLQIRQWKYLRIRDDQMICNVRNAKVCFFFFPLLLLLQNTYFLIPPGKQYVKKNKKENETSNL